MPATSVSGRNLKKVNFGASGHTLAKIFSASGPCRASWVVCGEKSTISIPVSLDAALGLSRVIHARSFSVFAAFITTQYSSGPRR
jgi:hypothetical protein